MAANAYLTSNVVVRADGVEYAVGTGDLPLTLALTSPGGVDPGRFSVANGATATLWDSTVGPCSSFKYLVILSDKTVMLEILGSSYVGHQEIFAGVPFQLASDNVLTAVANFAGAAQDIVKILAKNSSGSAALIQTLVCK